MGSHSAIDGLHWKHAELKSFLQAVPGSGH